MILGTIRSGWTPENRAAVTTDDTLVTAGATTMKYANVPATAYKPDIRHNAIEIAWSMGANNQSCVMYLFAARANGDIVQAYTTTITAGTQVATDLTYWVNTIAAGTETWITDIKIIDGGGSAERMGRIVLDTCGYKYFFCQYTGLSSESVRAFFSGY